MAGTPDVSEDEPASPRALGGAGRATAALAAVGVWLLVAVPVALFAFTHSERSTVVAGHEAVVRPTLDRYAVVDLGPFLPTVRYPTGSRVGAVIELGKTPLTSYDELVERYAFLASQPEGQIDKVVDVVRSQAIDAAAVGAVAGAAPVAGWFLLGARRRRELVATRERATRVALGGALALTIVTVLVLRPWHEDVQVDRARWLPIEEVVPEGVTIPAEAAALEFESDLLSSGTRRLVESAVDSYRRSTTFYSQAIEELQALAPLLRTPGEGEVTAVLVSDRHDNVGMDPVARAVADLAGATVLFDAGDDTSTGSSWEAFSLESLAEAFDGISARYYVAGNHDHGSFVADQAADLGFAVLDAEVVEGPEGIRLLGVADPRSSGLGNWRDETGLSFAEVEQRLADTACAADAEGERVTTVLVHDANLGRETLARGCADLVVAGHLHVVEGPDRVEGANGRAGYRFTTGTTGGAAYAVAIGTKPRRDATVSLVTYRDGRPVSVQSVSLSPLGRWTIGDAVPLRYDRESPAAEPARGADRRG